ncbi:ABC transporter substrate-binding protein [Mesonia aestuariivivens]|uniref:ABC transporter substrate-binding protein n=1 Tax=Mesonia aestuariivivens TaxID=2796128 RepID=A0ABS6W490_9FLAO|nr:ABC transporter substrate-binding protein [Mesonia aestuariivivens]MBW2962682.1 ABC transporter substrate-binding protein [Mesonia aestuariivivens]
MISKTKIGVLYPQSAQYKTISQDFIKGIKCNDLSVEYHMESIGIGSDEKIIIERIQKLQYQHDVNIIIGFFGHHKIEDVYQYVADNELILIASGLGATLPYSQAKYKGVYINSYALNESCYLLGKYLIEKGYSNIVSSTSYYDAGYGLLSSIETSLLENDLTFSGHYITPFMPRENEAAFMEQSIDNYGTDAVFAFHSGLYAKEHAAFIAQTELLHKFDYYIIPFTLNEDIFKGEDKNIYVVSSWLEQGTEEKNSTFAEQYNKENNKYPTVFTLLGYESGLIIKEVLQNEKTTSYEDVVNEINNVEISGPRGVLKFDESCNRTIFNHYIYKLVAYDENNLSFKKVETLNNTGHFIKKILSTPTPDKMGGWHNAYLCH